MDVTCAAHRSAKIKDGEDTTDNNTVGDDDSNNKIQEEFSARSIDQLDPIVRMPVEERPQGQQRKQGLKRNLQEIFSLPGSNDANHHIGNGNSYKQRKDNNHESSPKVGMTTNESYKHHIQEPALHLLLNKSGAISSNNGLSSKNADDDIFVKEESDAEDDGNDGNVDEETNEENHSNDGDIVEATTPVYSLPEGILLEWQTDRMGANLRILPLDDKYDNSIDEPTRKRELRVCLVGRAKISVIEGQLEVLGYAMTPEDDKDIFIASPFWSSWLTLEAQSIPCHIKLDCVRGASSFRIVAPTRPIIIPDEWKTSANTILQDFCPSPSERQNPLLTKSTALTRTSLEDDNLDSGVQTINQRYNHPRQVSMITGAKGVGKSTFLRYITNRLLNTMHYLEQPEQVAILDADVGQPELAPPGLLRLAIVTKPLFKPPYWNLVGDIDENIDTDDEKKEKEGSKTQFDNYQVISSIFFGATTSKADPSRYVDAIQFLMKKYEDHAGTISTPIPLLINMDGWVKGIGFQILSALIQILEPTHLIQILGETRAQSFDLSSNLRNDTNNVNSTMQLFQLPSCGIMDEVAVCRIPSLTLRNFRWATYFLPGKGLVSTFDAWDFVTANDLQTGWIAAAGRNFVKNEAGDFEDKVLNDECRLAGTLAKEKPYCVPMEAVECFVVGSDFEDHLQCTNDIGSHRRDRIFQALNGCIVALCTNTTTKECLGCGILRSIDWKQRLLYILVPPAVDPFCLSEVKALVGGSLPLPLAMLFRGVYSESFPYLTTLQDTCQESSSAILGSQPMRSRNNIGRRSLVNARRRNVVANH